MQPDRQLNFEAIGTVWSVDCYEPLPDGSFARLTAAIHERISRFDRAYSRFRDDSTVTAMSRAAGRFVLPADAGPLLRLYRELYELTGGAFTPLIGQTLSDAGYDAHYSLKPSHVTPPPAWDDVMRLEGNELVLNRPALLDFGAGGKGYLVDLVGEVMTRHGLSVWCVDAGGDMLYRNPGGTALHVGLEHPGEPGQVIGVAELQSGSLCGSAGNRRKWAGYHHILDPHTVQSPRHLQAVWVTAASGLLADALTTALYFCPPETLMKHYQFEYAIMDNEATLHYSKHFPANLFGAHV